MTTDEIEDDDEFEEPEDDGPRLTEEELHDRWKGRVSIRTLQRWRKERKGPPYFKFGPGVLYSLEDVRHWEKQQRHTPRADRELPRGAAPTRGEEEYEERIGFGRPEGPMA